MSNEGLLARDEAPLEPLGIEIFETAEEIAAFYKEVAARCSEAEATHKTSYDDYQDLNFHALLETVDAEMVELLKRSPELGYQTVRLLSMDGDPSVRHVITGSWVTTLTAENPEAGSKIWSRLLLDGEPSIRVDAYYTLIRAVENRSVPFRHLVPLFVLRWMTPEGRMLADGEAAYVEEQRSKQW